MTVDMGIYLLLNKGTKRSTRDEDLHWIDILGGHLLAKVYLIFSYLGNADTVSAWMFRWTCKLQMELPLITVSSCLYIFDSATDEQCINFT